MVRVSLAIEFNAVGVEALALMVSVTLKARLTLNDTLISQAHILYITDRVNPSS